jgi:hypothetical protein
MHEAFGVSISGWEMAEVNFLMKQHCTSIPISFLENDKYQSAYLFSSSEEQNRCLALALAQHRRPLRPHLPFLLPQVAGQHHRYLTPRPLLVRHFALVSRGSLLQPWMFFENLT